jgi:transposase
METAPGRLGGATEIRKNARACVDQRLSTLLPQLADVEVERTDQAADLVQILARTRANQAACPSCGVPSGRTHSRYRRRLADVAVGGRRLVIALTARRLFCDQPACQRRTFAEQVPGLTARYQRRTPGLTAMLEAIAIALVGRADARLTSALRATTSRSSLLRLLMALPDPPAATPRVLGVDDSRSSVARSTARC